MEQNSFYQDPNRQSIKSSRVNEETSIDFRDLPLQMEGRRSRQSSVKGK